MAKWRQFEENGFNYLKETFKQDASFHKEGGNNSYISDVKVEKNGKVFFIEIKQCPAQCGQFVLLPNKENKCFVYSPRNKITINKEAETIISRMNNRFEDFVKAGTEGLDIEPRNDQVFYTWIKHMYEQKKVKMVLTNNNAVILLNDFENHFHVTACYREKRSGSSKVGRRNMASVREYIRTNYEFVSLAEEEEGDLCFNVDDVEHVHEIVGKRFEIDNKKYFFSKTYKVRKLAKTSNCNVIFSITLKNKCETGLRVDEIKGKIKAYFDQDVDFG